MPRLEADAVEVFVYRRVGRKVEFLSLRRALNRRLPGMWQPVTGKVERRESAFDAARRELHEETGLESSRWHCLETASLYFDPRHDRFTALPIFAAEVAASARVRLSPEHDAWRWESGPRAGRAFLWNAQRAGLAAVRREVLGGGALARALEVRAAKSSGRTSRLTRRRATGRGRA
jgi:8-oxo-dGTP pyrophosphatase MutT (NUDIX family)